MARRAYALAFVIILLLAGIAGVFGARFLLQRLQADFAPRPGWTPPTATVPGEGDLPARTATVSVAMVRETSNIRPTATLLVVPTPQDVAPLPANTAIPADLTPLPTDALLGTQGFDGTPTVTVTETITAGATLTATASAADLPFILARPVRNSVGDCPGSYVLGQVTDRSGNPLPDVRLKLVDQYGNPQYATSKPGPGDKGLYDFPVTGPPRLMTLAVVDANDQPLSEQVSIAHQVGDNAAATCHRADWQRR